MRISLQNKIVLIEFGVIVLIALISSIGKFFNWQSFYFMYDLLAVPIGLINFVLSTGLLISNFQKNKDWVISFICIGILLIITGYFAFSEVRFSR
jgi:hypothetical protein